MANQCPKCGRFVKDMKCFTNWNGDIVKVVAKCSKCGTVSPEDWIYETFFPEPKGD